MQIQERHVPGLSVLSVRPGHHLGSVDGLSFPYDPDRLLRIIKVLQEDPDDVIPVPGALVGQHGLFVSAHVDTLLNFTQKLRFFFLCVMMMEYTYFPSASLALAYCR